MYVGGTKTDTLLVSNPGCDVLTVTSIASDHGDFAATPGTFDLQIDESQAVVVSFNPSSAAMITGALTIESNDPDEPTLLVMLDGEGMTAPEITVAPDSLFADLLTGETDTQVVTIANEGGSDLTFDIDIDELFGKVAAKGASAMPQPQPGQKAVGKTSLRRYLNSRCLRFSAFFFCSVTT